MKKITSYIICILCFSIGTINAQDVTTVTATDSDISENLDLEAIASVFAESENLEDFEKRINDPETQISNLDLNEDGEVDYLRVVENSKNETHLITIQAVIAKDQYQDVATIDVEKNSKGETTVQVVGDVYMYGPDYIITPVYVHPPVILVWFWGPLYHPWHSPFYWGYYPPYFRPWPPYPPHRYRTNVHVHVNVNHSYHRTTVRTSHTSVNIQKNTRRNDYGAKHPDRSYDNRKANINNSQKTRPANNAGNKASGSKESKVSTGKPVQNDWKPSSERNGQNSKVKDNKVSVPSNKTPSTTRPSQSKDTKPSSKPSTQPSTKPSTQPSTKPSTQPSSRPSTQPSTRPSSHPDVSPSSSPSRQQSTRPSSGQHSRPASSTSHNSRKR